MKNRRILLFLLCAILTLGMLAFTGCSKEPDTSQPDESGEEAKQEYQIELYFANAEYIATGDETLDKFMVSKSKLTSMPQDIYFDTLEALRTVPEAAGYSTVITDQIKVNDAYVDGDTAFVDFDSNGLNGGSLEESFLISQIVNTLIHSFENVKQVQFLVDGEAAESLMGHVDATDPFTKDLFTE